MTLYLSNRDGDGKTSEEGHFKLQTQILTGDTLGATSMLVTQSTPLGMSVSISPGDFKIDTTFGYSYTGWSNANQTLAITTADPATPRITTIVAYVDRMAPTAPVPANNPGIIKLLAVNGNPQISATAPTDETIQNAVGANNPFIILADVRVNAGAQSITNANIGDRRKLIGLGHDMVASDAIQNLSITSAKLDNSSVTTNKVADNQITLNKINWASLNQKTTNPWCIQLGNIVIQGGYAIAPAGTGGDNKIEYVQVNFPIAYAENPSVTATIRDTNNQTAWVAAITPTYARLKQKYNGNLTVSWMAIGRI